MFELSMSFYAFHHFRQMAFITVKRFLTFPAFIFADERFSAINLIQLQTTIEQDNLQVEMN